MSNGQSIAQVIIQTAKALPVTLLGWDGSKEPQVILDNLKQYIHRYAGWKLLSVSIDGSVVRIETPDNILLSYDVVTGREIYGRVRHFGLTSNMLDELKCLA